MALAALFSACGDDSGSNSSRGEDPSPEVAELELANGKAVVCDDDMDGVVAITADDGYRKCVDGEWIKIKKFEAMKADKIIGQLEDDDDNDDDDDDADTESSSSQKQSSSSKKSSILDEDDDDNDGDDDDVIPSSSNSVIPNSSSSVIPNSSSSVIPNSSNSVIPNSSSSVIPNSSNSVIPSDSEGSSSSKGGSSVIYVCPDGTVVANLENCKTPSSSPSDTPNTSTSENPGTSASETPGTSSGVIPGTDPESSSDEAVDLSYATKCPAGHTCTYAPTEYLNPKVSYGELLDERDYQMYKTVEICDKDNKNCQTWMAQNLNYAYTGVPFDIGNSTSDSTSWCYGDDPSNCGTYGRLYTWAAAVDSVAIYRNYGEKCGYGKTCARFSASALATAPVRGVCPSGWHLPSDAEWSALYTNVGGNSYAGQKLKANTSLWYSNAGTDEYGFSVLPAGDRRNDGSFYYQGYYASFWSSTEDGDDSNSAWYQYFRYNYDYVRQNYYVKYYGFSVRCLKDSPDQGGEATDPEPPSEVKADGYYKTYCPAGLDCKYATTTDYLNSSKTYGEILDTRDGQVYKTIKICDEDNKNCQTWMAQNLNYRYVGEKYNYDGYTSDSTSWCYDDDPSNCGTYGRLYTWAAAVDSVAIYKNYGEECGYGKSCTRFSATALATAPVRGVCPSGWHLPSKAEWSALYTNVGGTGTAGQKLKANSGLWYSNTGTDEYGFSVLPAGGRYYSGDFDGRDYDAYFWSSTEDEYGSLDAWYRYFYCYDDDVNQYGNGKYDGFSVRCLKDSI